MPLFFPENAKSQDHQSKPASAAQKPAVQAMSDHQSKTKDPKAAAVQMTFSANKKHPLQNLCRRCKEYEINHQDKPS